MSTLQALQGDKISILRQCVLFTEGGSYNKYSINYLQQTKVFIFNSAKLKYFFQFFTFY